MIRHMQRLHGQVRTGLADPPHSFLCAVWGGRVGRGGGVIELEGLQPQNRSTGRYAMVGKATIGKCSHAEAPRTGKHSSVIQFDLQPKRQLRVTESVRGGESEGGGGGRVEMKSRCQEHFKPT